MVPLERTPTHMPLVDPHHRFIIFWTPRCGSTTLLAWFFEAIGLASELRTQSAHALRSKWQAENPISSGDLQRMCLDPSVLKFVVCRNPFDRIVSSYYLVLSHGSAQWNGILRKRPGLDPERRFSFRGFIDFLGSEDLDSCDLHWRRQSSQVWHRLAVPVTKFVRVESLEGDLEYMGQLCGVRATVRRTSVTPRTEIAAPKGIDCMDLHELSSTLPRDDRGRICFPESSTFLSAFAVERIKTLYEADFASLGYGASI